MGYALVSAGAASPTLSPSFGQPTAAGNLLTAWVYSDTGGSTDPFNPVTGWSKAVVTGASFNWMSIWYKPNCSAGETAPVFTTVGSSFGANTQLAEFSGGATSSPLDSSGLVAHFGAAQTATCAAPDTAAGDLILFIAAWNGGSGTLTIGQTLNDSSGASVTPNITAGPGPNPSGVYFTFVWGVAGAGGASADTGTATLSSAVAGAAGIASFMAAAAAAGGAAPLTLVIPQAAVMQAANW